MEWNNSVVKTHCCFRAHVRNVLNRIALMVYYPFKKYVEYIFSPGGLSMMSHNSIFISVPTKKYLLAARTIEI